MLVFHENDVVGFICVRNELDTSGIHDVKQSLLNQIQILANYLKYLHIWLFSFRL